MAISFKPNVDIENSLALNIDATSFRGHNVFSLMDLSQFRAVCLLRKAFNPLLKLPSTNVNFYPWKNKHYN